MLSKCRVRPYRKSPPGTVTPRRVLRTSNLRAPSTTAIFNRNRNFQRLPRPNFPCMGSSNRNHLRNLQVAVVVAVDQNFLIFGGRSLKSRLRLRWCMGRNDQICHISADICMLLNKCIDTNENIFTDIQEVK